MKGIKGERRENEWEKSERVTKCETPNSGKQSFVWMGGWGDWVTGTEGGT